MNDTDLEPMISAGHLVIAVARKLHEQGKTEEARKMYLRAFKQGLLIRELKSQRFIEWLPLAPVPCGSTSELLQPERRRE